MSINKITTHVNDALERLLFQYKDKVRMNGMISSTTEGLQELENTFWDVLTLRWINSASGEQLDRLGAIVVLDRDGRTDEQYRVWLVGKIAINTSKGTPQNLVAAMNLLFGADKSQYIPVYPAGVEAIAGSPPIASDNLFNDSDMEASGVGDWLVQNSATLTKNIVTPHAGTQSLRIERNGVDNPGAGEAILEAGEYYFLYGWTRTSGTAKPVIRTDGGVIRELVAYGDWYNFASIFTAGASNIMQLSSDITAANPADWVEYDDVYLYKLKFSDTSDLVGVLEMVVPAGVTIVAVAHHLWFPDDSAKPFGFKEALDAGGFGSVADPTIGGFFSSILYGGV